jgi:membrane protein implicated in regulation of membrane protease activity
MAKKIRKTATTPTVLFIELLVPWIVMAAIGVACISAGLSDITSIIIALAGAVTVTFIIRKFEQNRLLRKMRTSR